MDLRHRSGATAAWALTFVASVLLLSSLPAAAVAHRCGGRQATLIGTASADVLIGTIGDDVIVGLAGDDDIQGRGGDDLICGGSGADIIVGGDGNDRILGNDGGDTITGGNGDDILLGGAGLDTIRGFAGDDHLDGGIGADTMSGGFGDDSITGGPGHDVATGGGGADTITGDKGDDRLNGGSGDDDIDGGPGTDHIVGGGGDDVGRGGPGDDTLDGGSGTDACDGGDGADGAAGCEAVVSTEIGQLPAPRIRPSSNAIALTFDDGPHPLFTPPILDILDEYGAKATFFVLGWQAKRYPELLREIVARGHSVQNHTWFHKRLTSWSNRSIEIELGKAQDALVEISGMTPRCFRPPYGATNARVRGVAAGMGLTEVMWDASGADWMRPPVSSIVRRVLRAGGGDIVLLHDAGGIRWNTVAALPLIIEGFELRGLTFETLCD